AERPDLGMGVGQESRDLCLKSSRVHDLSERRVSGQRQQVARDVEGTSFKRAIVLSLVHIGRLGCTVSEVAEHTFRETLVLADKKAASLVIKIFAGVVAAEIGGIKAALAEILIARGTFLTVPTLLVDEGYGREQAQFLDCERYMRKIGDGAMAVLEIES